MNELPKGTVLSLRDENGNILLELTTLDDGGEFTSGYHRAHGKKYM